VDICFEGPPWGSYIWVDGLHRSYVFREVPSNIFKVGGVGHALFILSCFADPFVEQVLRWPCHHSYNRLGDLFLEA